MAWAYLEWMEKEIRKTSRNEKPLKSVPEEDSGKNG